MARIIYAGTPEFAVPALKALIDGPHELVAVYTQPDRPAGRGRKLQQSPVKQMAIEAGVDVRQPIDFRADETVQALQALQADVMVVAAYGLLLPVSVLETPRFGCINIHASLLPRWRGASPIQQAILAGDPETGITLMKMDAGLDTGDIISSRSLALDPEWNAQQLHDALAPLGAELLIEALADLDDAIGRARPQQSAEATYAPRLTKQQAEIDWNKPALLLQREVQAYCPWPVSFTLLDGEPLRIWRAARSEDVASGEPGEVVAHDRDAIYVSCADALLRVTELQFSGRKRCSAGEALNAGSLCGRRLGRPA